MVNQSFQSLRTLTLSPQVCEHISTRRVFNFPNQSETDTYSKAKFVKLYIPAVASSRPSIGKFVKSPRDWGRGAMFLVAKNAEHGVYPLRRHPSCRNALSSAWTCPCQHWGSNSFKGSHTPMVAGSEISTNTERLFHWVNDWHIDLPWALSMRWLLLQIARIIWVALLLSDSERHASETSFWVYMAITMKGGEQCRAVDIRPG